ncbi:hypothetical protein MVEN_02157800 [Mycena venus]|uniref:F-box domain-containing protein n=1 Tax=Mycena venus TaxID=2733690 RepID=A0A8H6X7Q8_9AGAR|nr:hypothetical protein MVEN_02157800 [Mycena venus]
MATHSHTTTSLLMEAPTNYLHILPAEVWLACWVLCSLRQLRRISLVCKLFRSLVLPELFREQTLDVAVLERGLKIDNWVERVHHLHRTAVRLDGLVDGSFAPLVRTWKVALGNSTQPLSRFHPEIENIDLFNVLRERVVTTFCTTLTHSSNLYSLHIENTTITASLRETLGSLSSLRELHLGKCDILASDGLLPLPLETLKLYGLHLIAGRPLTGPIQLASPDSLRTLDVGPYMSPVIAGFGSSTLWNLVQLSVGGVPDFGELFHFLSQCPQLQVLQIQPRNHSDSRLPVLPATTVPLLHDLTGPPAMIQALATTHHVRHVKILDDRPFGHTLDDLMPFCMNISRNPVPLHSLILPCKSPTLEPLAAITSLFPELKELSVEFPDLGKYRWCGTTRTVGLGRRAEHTTVPIDRRMPDLCDDTAFNSLPADEMSDEESEVPSMNTRNIMGYKEAHVALSAICYTGNVNMVLGWIVSGSLLLPPDIELIAVFTQSYPHLRELQFGLPSNHWKRTGGLWSREESGHRESLEVCKTETDVL